MLDSFLDAVIVDLVARCLRPEQEVIANGLLDEAVTIVAANHRVGQVHVLDLGLQLAPIVLVDLATEDHGDLVRLADCSIGIEQALAEIIQCGTTREDEVVAVLDLREEQPMLAALAVKKGVRCASHFWPQVTRSRGVSELASSCRRSGSAHFKKALANCLNPMPFSRIRFASQWCWLRQIRAENGR